MASPARLTQEIFLQSGTSPSSTARPSKAPPAVPTTSTAVAKAPPPGATQRFDALQQPVRHPDIFRWLEADPPLEVTTAVPAQAQDGSRGTTEQRDLSSGNLEEQDEGISSELTASETATVGAQRATVASRHTSQAPHHQLEANPWSDFEDELTQASNTSSTAASTQHRTVDIRTLQAAALPPTHHPRQRRTLWDSWRLNPRPTNEIIFLTVWLRVLREHDYGTVRVWQQYCTQRGEGTFDPAKLSPTFIRQYLFIYGSQPANFFTQNLTCGLLTASQKRAILREAAHIYQATHEGNTPPHSSITWPPRPEQLPPIQHNAALQQDMRAAPTIQHNPTHQRAVWAAPAAHHNAMQQQHNPPGEAYYLATPHQAAWHGQYATTRQDWQYTPAWGGWEDYQPTGWSWSLHSSWGAWHWH